MNSSTTANYILVSDIDFSEVATSTWNSGAGFIPIGSSASPFTGTFDGKGHKITGLYINRPTTNGVGLFGYTGPYTTMIIKDIGLENVNITGQNNVGGIIGIINSGTISNSYTTGNIVANGINSGGLTGGTNNSNYSFSMNNSFSRANVRGTTNVGGAIGYSRGTITNIYSTGLISGTSAIGGLVAINNGTFISSYWDTQNSGTTTSAGGTGKTTSEMQTQSTFTNWDFDTIWVMNGYPILRIMTNTVTYIAGDNGSITGTTSQSVNTGGSSTEVTAVPNTGYHFTSWNDGVLTASRIDSNVLTNASYTANFSINTYTATYTAGSNGSVSGNTSQIVNYGGNGTEVTAIPNTGYHFVSWSDNVSTASRTDLNITDNISVTANFEIDTHTLTYTAGEHGTISGSSTQIVNYGSNGIQVEAIPDEDYRFVQ